MGDTVRYESSKGQRPLVGTVEMIVEMPDGSRRLAVVREVTTAA